MPQKDLVINNRELNYKGLFRLDEVFSTINQAIEKRAYKKKEKRSEETVTEEGRKVEIELRPFQVVADYVTLMIKIKIIADNVQEKSEVVNDQKRLFQQGDLKIIFDSWSLTDYENRWGMKPWVYFWKGVISKYIYQLPTEVGWRGKLMGDTAYIYAQVKKLLSSYKIEAGTFVKEDDVRAKIQEEIEKEVEEEKSD
jgi:hypothetical protein